MLKYLDTHKPHKSRKFPMLIAPKPRQCTGSRDPRQHTTHAVLTCECPKKSHLHLSVFITECEQVIITWNIIILDKVVIFTFIFTTIKWQTFHVTFCDLSTFTSSGAYRRIFLGVVDASFDYHVGFNNSSIEEQIRNYSQINGSYKTPFCTSSFQNHPLE